MCYVGLVHWDYWILCTYIFHPRRDIKQARVCDQLIDYSVDSLVRFFNNRNFYSIRFQTKLCHDPLCARMNYSMKSFQVALLFILLFLLSSCLTHTSVRKCLIQQVGLKSVFYIHARAPLIHKMHSVCLFERSIEDQLKYAETAIYNWTLVSQPFYTIHM